MSKLKRLCIFCLFCALLQAAMADDMTVHSISLHNRTANDLIPLIQPMLPAGSVVTGQNYDLLIKTTPSGFEQIQPVISDLDKPPQSLTLRIRRVSSNALDTQLATGNQGTVYSSQSAGNTDQVQRVTVLDGQSAFVETGQSFPYHDYGISVFGATDVTQYKDVKTGVILTPHLQGDQVQVKVQWSFNKLQHDNTQWEQQNSNITEEKADTVVTVPLGQWVNISGSSSQSLQQESSSTLSTYNVQNPNSNLFISVVKTSSRND